MISDHNYFDGYKIPNKNQLINCIQNAKICNKLFLVGSFVNLQTILLLDF